MIKKLSQKKWLTLYSLFLIALSALVIFFKKPLPGNDTAKVPHNFNLKSMPSGYSAPAAMGDSAGHVSQSQSQGDSGNAIEGWIEKESAEMNRLQSNPEEIRHAIIQRALSLSANETNALSKMAQDAKRHKNERFLATFLLAKNVSGNQAHLVEILLRENHLEKKVDLSQASDHQKQFEQSLNIFILMALEKEAIKDMRLIETLEQSIQRTEDQQLQKIAFASLQSARRGVAYWNQISESLSYSVGDE